MLVQHRLALKFATAHVQEPLTWEMTQRFRNLMFNVTSVNVGVNEADMHLALVGKADEVRQAKAYLKDLGVKIMNLGCSRYRGALPDVATGLPPKDPLAERIERTLWLTIVRSQKREPLLWTLGRCFDIGYKIGHAATGPTMAVVSLIVWGSQQEVERAVSYLRDRGICVEYGEAGVSAPFAPMD
jgi:hypothetical protein